MLRVRKEDLRLGMFIQSLEGSWFSHPFWKSKFLLTEPDDLRALQSSAEDTVWIDPSKSLAPAIAHLGLGEPAPQSRLVKELAPAVPAETAPVAPSKPKRTPRLNEFQGAQSVLNDCMTAVGALFTRIRCGNAAALEEAGPVVASIAESVARNPDALIALTRVRSLDEYTYLHSVAVSALMINLAKELGLPADYIRQAGTAGLFMDVGKAFLSAELLTKPSVYSEEDWVEMRRHPQLGAEAVKSGTEMSKIVVDVCLHHHEKYDGTGYPHKLAGDEISLFARMAAICDAYDAIGSDRPHRPGRGPADAVAELYKLKGHFDESLLTSFIKSIGIYPVGSLVRLASGMLACVAAQRRDQLTRPVVRTFYSIPRRAHVPVQEIDLAQEAGGDRIVSREEPARWGLADWGILSLTILQGQRAKRAA